MPATAPDVTTLRDLLERRFPDTQPPTHRTARPVATGVVPLDRILPSGGLPRGRLSVWAPGGGATALLRAACRSVTERGERAAWVDGAGTLSGEAWETETLLLRPHDPADAGTGAEVLLHSGGVALVVFTGAAERGGNSRVRLSRAAREGGGSLVVVSGDPFMAGLRLTARIRPNGYRWRPDPRGEPAEVGEARVRIRAIAPGWNREAEIVLPVRTRTPRLAPEPHLRDRRGALRPCTA